MSQYRNSPAGFAVLRKRLILTSIVVSLVVILFAIIVTYFSAGDTHIGLSTWIVVTVVLLGILSYAFIKTIKQQKEIYNSYSLDLGSDYLTRQQTGVPPVTLYFADISEVVLTKDGSLLVKGQKQGDFIYISAQIEDYEQLKNSLELVKPFGVYTAKTVLQKFPYLLPTLAIFLMAAVYIFDNKTIVAISGIFLIALLGWSFYKILISKELNIKAKRSLWYLPVILISIIAIVCYKVFVQ